MTDDKEIKYILPYTQKHCTEKQRTLYNIISKRRENNFETGKMNKKCNLINNITIIVQRKKNSTVPTYKSNHIEEPFKTKSIPIFYFNSSGKKIPLELSASLQNLSYNQNNQMTRSSQMHLFYPKWDIYRCQLSTQEESCCCSCNSDAMFEVMKSLYDCYKKKNCDHCNCILCGHLPREERRLGELRKTGSITSGIKEKKKEKRKIKSKELLNIKQAKTSHEKEALLKKLILSGVAIPEPKTASEKDLIEKVKTQLALPPQPRSKSEKTIYKRAEAEGLITPLEGKTRSQKLKILERQKELGLPLPEGRTLSEKELIQRIKSGGVVSEAIKVPSEKLRKAKKEGFLTPLDGKTPEQKKIILKGLVMNGIPLPKGKSNSERDIIDQVRDELGLPPEPKTMSEKKKYKSALKAGIITPLEGKTARQKEEILKKHAEFGLPLPQGRTPSEKSLIAKIKKTVRPPSEFKVPSVKMRQARAEGLLTPLEGKTQAQKEKILRGLAQHNIPLPEAKTESDRKIISKVRAELGLPPERVTSSEKSAHKKEHADKIRRASEVVFPKGATPERERILKNIAMQGKRLPDAKTPSEENILNKVRRDLGLPPEPKSQAQRDKYNEALATGIIQPLEGKSKLQKEKTLQAQADMGIPLPEGRTASERALIKEIQSGKRKRAKLLSPTELKKLETKTAKKMKEGKGPSDECICDILTRESEKGSIKSRVPSEKVRMAKEAGLLTPLEGKSVKEKERILKSLAKAGLPLPKPKTASEKDLIEKVKTQLALPPQPRSKSEKTIYKRAEAEGLITPLEGKTRSQKLKILERQKDLGLPLPEGRTLSEKLLIQKIKSGGVVSEAIKVPSEKLRKAKREGFLTPLDGKTPEQKKKILKGLVMNGIPLPKGKSNSERDIIDQVRDELGLPPEPKTISEKKNYKSALKAGIITPLEGKTARQKEEILKKHAEFGLPLPQGRTPSEKSLIAKIKKTVRPPSEFKVPSVKMRQARAEGLLTPLEGKTQAQKEKILRGLAQHNIPLPEAKTESDRKIISKVRAELGLPPERVTSSEKSAHKKEHADKIRRASEVVFPKGATPERERILKNIAMQGKRLPDAKTPSEENILNKVRRDLGLPPEPKSQAQRDKYNEALATGIIQPLEGKSKLQKEKTLQAQADMGIPLPEGRTASERALIKEIQSGKRKRAKLLSPTELKKLETKTAKKMKEGKGPSDECICDILTRESEKGSIKSRVPSEKVRMAKEAGLLTPLEGKSVKEKERILKSLAKAGLPLPKPKTASEKDLIEKVKTQLALPPQPRSKSEKTIYKRAEAEGLITPLEGKTRSQKLKILERQKDLGLPLPEGRTLSEKLLIQKIKSGGVVSEAIKVPSEKLRKAKREGFLTPLDGKTPEQKKKILKGLVMNGIPLPKGKSNSERDIIDQVRDELGLPPEPKTISEKKNYKSALKAGIITPLEGKTARQKEEILKKHAEFGLPLPQGRTPSEKSLIAKIKKTVRPPSEFKVPSVKMRQARAEGLLTPLEGKTQAQKEKILRGLAQHNIPLPKAKTESDRKIISKVRAELGLPPERVTSSEKSAHKKEHAEKIRREEVVFPKGATPERERILKNIAMQGKRLPDAKTPSEENILNKVRRDLGLPPEPKSQAQRDKYNEALATGIIQPLEGKSKLQKEKILQAQADMGIPLPEGRTSSERALIKEIKSGKRRRAKFLSPPELKKLDTKTAKKMKEGKGPSDECICDILTRESENGSIKSRVPSEKIRIAKEAGLLTPLEGKSVKEKERILKRLAKEGLPLPEPKTASEKVLIEKVKIEMGMPTGAKPSEKLRKARAAGLLTPMIGKSNAEKEQILIGLARNGIPLPKAQTSSEKKLVEKVRKNLGLPPEPKTSSIRYKYDQAYDAGLITPLEGKNMAQKEHILTKQAEMGLPLPEGRTHSEKNLINRIRKTVLPKKKSEIIGEIGGVPITASKKAAFQKAKAEGLLTPLKGKSMAEKEKIVRGLAVAGLPLPKGKTASEKKIVEKVRKNLGLPPEPKTSSIRYKYDQAHDAGLITPLEGKNMAQKEHILTKQAEMGLPLPEGRTHSEKDLINRIRKTVLPKKKSEIIGEIGGVPITASKKAAFQKAKAEGLLTPLKGKSMAEKEKIVRGLAEAGLPLPKGKTASEKVMIQKVRSAFGLSPESTTSVKHGKIKTKSRQIGIDIAKKSEVAVGVGKSKFGIKEEYQDIIKTTTCDRGCGCDRKKIRFKHSYVKIRVTSPDISSLCPCPDECVPGVKGGVFTDNEGIKVTVGQVSAALSFTSKDRINTEMNTKYKNDKDQFSSILNDTTLNKKNILQSERIYGTHGSSMSLNNCIDNRLRHTRSNSETLRDTYIFIKSSDESFEPMLNIDIPILIGGFESSPFPSSSNNSICSKSISIISISVSNCSSNSIYLIESISDYSSQSNKSITNLEIADQDSGIVRLRSTVNIDLGVDLRSDNILNYHTGRERKILRLSTNTINNIYNCVNTPTHPNLASVISKIISREALDESSSLYLLLPTSSDDSFTHFNCKSNVSSTICIQLSENPFSYRGCFDTNYDSEFQQRKQKYLRGLKISANARHKSIERNSTTRSALKVKERFEIYTDTTEDRPCCCDVEQDVNKKTLYKTGFNRGNYRDSEVMRKQGNISYRTKKLGPDQTPEQLCKISSCGHFSDSTQYIRNVPMNSNLNKVPTSTSKQCECNFEKLKELLEKIGSDLVSKSCGNSTVRIGTKMNKEHENIKPITKNTNLRQSSKSHDCISYRSSSKDELKGQCPCAGHALETIQFDSTKPTNVNKNSSYEELSEKKSSKKKNKRHICECPLVPQSELDTVLWVDEDEIRRMKSALTQNMSGFKITSVPKEPEPEISFEEALSYVIQSDQEKYGKLFCLCHEKYGKKKKTICECPPESVPEKSVEELKGIKLHIGGKGSSSKGLGGVLCFQLVED